MEQGHITRKKLEELIWTATEGTDLQRAIENDTKLISVGDSGGNTLLHKAAEAGNKVFVKILLEKGANVNSKNSLEQTPLHIAVTNNRDEIAKLLLEHVSD